MTHRHLLALMMLLATAVHAAGGDKDRLGDPLPRGAIARYGTLEWRHEPGVEPWLTKPRPTDEENERLGYPDSVARLGDLVAAGHETGTIVIWPKVGDAFLMNLLGHEDSVETLLFLGGDRLASASTDGTVRLWDLKKGVETARISMPDGPADSLRISPDGSVLFADDVLGYRRIDLAKGAALEPDPGHLGDIQHVGISPDGKLVASSTGARTIHLWDAATGRNIRILRGHRDTVTGLAFSPDGALLASTDYAGAVLLWDTRTWAPRRTNARHYMRAHRVAFAPASGWLITGGVWGSLRIWDAPSGAWVWSITAHQNEDWKSNEVTSLAVSPDGTRVASVALDERIELHSVRDGRLVRSRGADKLPSPPVAVAFSPDGERLAVIGKEGLLLILGGEHLEDILAADGGWTAAAWAPGGDFIAAGTEKGELHLLHPDDLAEITKVRAHDDAIDGISLSADGRRLVTGCRDGTLLVFDITALLGREPAAAILPVASPPEPTLDPPGPPTDGRAKGLKPGESIHAYEGFIPGSAPDGIECIFVVDGTTGRPLRNAAVNRFAEVDPGPAGILLGKARTDEHGIAWIDRSDGTGDDQWVIDATGFAAQSSLQGDLPAMTVLFPGRTLRGRILDPFGNLASGVEVELFVGCGHSPAIRTARTDERGVFRLDHVNADQGRMLWIRGAGIASEYLEAWPLWRSPDAFPDFVTNPGVRLSLEVVEEDGRPAPGLWFGAEQSYRGPWAEADHKGRCVLSGLVPDGDVNVHDPDPDGTRLGQIPTHPWFMEDKQRTLIRPPIGLEVGDLESRGSVETRFLLVDEQSGEPVGGLSVAAVSLANGFRFDGDGEWVGPAGLVSVLAPPGRYLVGAGGPHRSHAGGPVEVEVTRDPGDPIRIPLRRNARLEIEAKGLEDSSLRIVSPRGGHDFELDDEEPVFLPPDGPAALHVKIDQVRAFPVGPEKDGVRSVDLTLTEADREELGDDMRALEQDPPAVEVTCCLAGGEPAPGALVRVWQDAETGIAEGETGDHTDAGGRAWIEPDEGSRFLLEIRRKGFTPLHIPLGPTATWGRGRLDLTVADADGAIADFGIWLDGTLLTGEEGKLAIAGLDAGPHVLIVGSPWHHAQRIEFRLAEGESRSLRIELPRR